MFPIVLGPFDCIFNIILLILICHPLLRRGPFIPEYTQGALWLKYAVLLPKLFFFQSGFPSSLKQFSGPDLCKYSGSRPVWSLRPWHRAGSPEGGQEALQGVKFYLSV